MTHTVIINQRQQRREAAKLCRSEALNRTLTTHRQTVQALKSELFATRVAAGIALASMLCAMLYALRGAL